MRKTYKRKRRACGLCKPHKRGWAIRWKAKEVAKRQSMDQEMRRQAR